MIIYVSIGNSDDKLNQKEWATFQKSFAQEMADVAVLVHGVWFSEPTSRYQNACICMEIDRDSLPEIRGLLGVLAADYSQDSIALAHISNTEMVRPVR